MFKNVIVISVFLSALLLFSIQPMFAKLLLPRFGGSASVWSACMLFFQLFLLVGYGYAHLLQKVSNIVVQQRLHLVIVFASLVFLPVSLEQLDVYASQLSPTTHIVVLLLISIGLPYSVLSASSPLFQVWLSQQQASVATYKLYAVSNAGSLIALFSYPFVIEFSFTIAEQKLLWSLMYGIFTTLLLVAHWLTQKASTPISAQVEQKKHIVTPPITHQVLWLLLSCVGVILMISTTNNMTVNVPPIPFLWVVPLGLYLITFIVSFGHDKAFAILFWRIALLLCSLIGVLLFFIGSQFTLFTQIGLYLLVFFVACMICHKELANLKPNTQFLTQYYLIIACGGVLGSLVTTVVAVSWFNHYYEYVVGLILVAVLTFIIDQFYSTPPATKKLAISSINLVNIVLPALLFWQLIAQFNQYDIYQTRNFYGILQVKDIVDTKPPQRHLIDGYTSHGAQQLNTELPPKPLSYYRQETGIAHLLSHPEFYHQKRVGIIGLGVGALAYYGQETDQFVFYELNPSVELVARQYFDFLSSSKASIDVRLGDARITLQHETLTPSQQAYDILVVDAFSSDAIPMHLLTAEAFELYTQHLSNDGVLAFHISNSYLDLAPVIAHHADVHQFGSLLTETVNHDNNQHKAMWLFVSKDQTFLELAKWQSADFSVLPMPSARVNWTDDYSSLLSVMK